MRPSKFVMGLTGGAVLTLLMVGALLLGLGGLLADAASGTPTPPAATATPLKQGAPSGTPSTSIARTTLEQQMLQPVSDAEWGAAANQLGMSVDDIGTALKSGKSVAELAPAHHLTAQQVKGAMVAAGREKVAAAVQAGTITQSDADTLNQGLVVAIADKVTNGNSQMTDAKGKSLANSVDQQSIDAISNSELSAAANQLGIGVDALMNAIDGGQTVADLASARGVTVQQIEDAMAAAGQAKVRALLQAGTISQAQADDLDQTVVVGIAEKIAYANTQQSGEKSAGTQQGTPDVADTVTTAELSAAAQALGITNAQFKAVLGPDGNLSDAAASKHVTGQQVKEAMLSAAQVALTQAVQNGTISQAEADQINHDVAQPLAEKIAQMISGGSEATPTT